MEEDQISLDVNIDVDLLESIARKLDTLGKPNEADNFTIFPVPYKFRQSKENLFEPSAVSIGPFHHGRTRVQAVEEQKWWSLRDFLSRGDHICLDLCLSEIKKLEERTRRCYSESVPMGSNSFVEMMLLDGCFLLEYFLKRYENELYYLLYGMSRSFSILLDFLLVENQIPFFIVDKLCEIGIEPDNGRDFKKYLANFLTSVPINSREVGDPRFEIPLDEIHHLVHLRYYSLIPINLRERPVVLIRSESFFPSMLSRIKNFLLDFPLWVLTRIFPKRNSLSLSLPKSPRIPCATELQNAGIKLRPKSHPNHMLDISFDHRVLQIPELIISNDTITILANLIAFEQYKSDNLSANLSSFVLFLDSLVNTPEDVMILQQCGIINNYLDSDKELIDFFNQICKEILVETDHFMAELVTAVNKCCESKWTRRRARWNRHKTQFIRTYFSSPWTAISLVAAVVIVLLTCVQSFFAVYAYYVPPS